MAAPLTPQSVFMLLVAALGLGFFAATYYALRRWRGGWRLAALLPLLGVIGAATKIAVDIGVDPTAHNLWPFEVLGAVGIAGAALGGLWLAHLLTQRWSRRAESG